MRITCVLGPYFPVPAVLGGAVERIWHNLCTQFASKGHEVTVISRRYGDFPRTEVIDGVRHVRLPSRDAPRSRLLYRLFDLAYAGRVVAALPESDITITNSVSLPLILPRRRAGKIYVSVARFPKGQMTLYRRADRLQAVSRAVADAIRAQSPAMANRVRVLPNCLSPAFSRLVNPATVDRRREILYVGRIAREKGLDLLIRAFKLLPDKADWILTILGPSEAFGGGDGRAFLDALRHESSALGERVRFEAPIFDEAKLAARMQAAAIFAYPSVAETGESFGMAPLEAMACGCAVIVSDLACFRDFAVHNQNAIVFDHQDASGAPLAKALRMLVDDPDRRARLGRDAVATAHGFHSERVAELFVRDFAELERN